jgi:two-component system phosphate regulon sensor histidine kinase PhoR
MLPLRADMHKNRYKYVSMISAAAVLLLLGLYMWMTYRSVTKDITERAGNQLSWAMFYESYSRAEIVTEGDTLSLPEARGNLSLASSVEGMNDALSHKYNSDVSLENVAMLVDSLLSVVHINRDVTILEVDSDRNVLRQNNDRCSSWSLYTKPVSIRRDQSKAIQLALNNPYPELAQKLSPLFLISAIILGFFAIIIVQLLRFITEQEQMAELRNDFSYAMVHDMKSPLSSIIMGAHFLHSGKVDDKPQIKEKYYTIIEEEAEHLLALVNKLLTISKLENKKLILNKWDIYIEPIINDLVEKAKAKATKPLEITTHLEVKNVLADEQYLTEAIANLIDNAIKYSKDEIKIDIKTIDTDKNILLKVRDNGIGITKEEQQIIFDKFGRAAIHEKNRKGGVSGFGLGLNYVDQVMRAHGGKVTVSSEKDKYSEFTLYIPKNV